ncbi:MAG: sigma-70 family RNA polymerase sigma factor, partial [Nitrososphaera sp.]|uniref:sigma-70 family RNA polymerase sigma factor n=1 Tax=Nitrososphaera sp. TaxID=1971748 RepID=UPI003D6F9818
MVERQETLEPASRDEIATSYRRLRTGLLSYFRGRVEDAATAEDLLQTVILKVLASGQSARSSETMASWLYKIARNALIDHYRARRPVSELTDDLELEATEDTSSIQGLSACLLPFVQQLPSIYRDVLLSTEFQGKPMQAVASDLSLSLSAVKSRASRGRRMLKDKLLACCDVELSSSGEITD